MTPDLRFHPKKRQSVALRASSIESHKRTIFRPKRIVHSSAVCDAVLFWGTVPRRIAVYGVVFAGHAFFLQESLSSTFYFGGLGEALGGLPLRQLGIEG